MEISTLMSVRLTFTLEMDAPQTSPLLTKTFLSCNCSGLQLKVWQLMSLFVGILFTLPSEVKRMPIV
jgi:hypothetical protein